jgi:hypothetical protein
MNILIIDEDTKAQVRQVVEYSLAARNHYFIRAGGKSYQKPPGENPNHIVQLHSYRCVFSISIEERTRKAWRHLSISVREKGKFAAPIVAFTIAGLFGFTGWNGVSEKPPSDWAGTLNKEENCVLLFQEFKAN